MAKKKEYPVWDGTPDQVEFDSPADAGRFLEKLARDGYARVRWQDRGGVMKDELDPGQFTVDPNQKVVHYLAFDKERRRRLGTSAGHIRNAAALRKLATPAEGQPITEALQKRAKRSDLSSAGLRENEPIPDSVIEGPRFEYEDATTAASRAFGAEPEPGADSSLATLVKITRRRQAEIEARDEEMVRMITGGESEPSVESHADVVKLLEQHRAKIEKECAVVTKRHKDLVDRLHAYDVAIAALGALTRSPA